jgi:hypothetical protein
MPPHHAHRHFRYLLFIATLLALVVVDASARMNVQLEQIPASNPRRGGDAIGLSYIRVVVTNSYALPMPYRVNINLNGLGGITIEGEALNSGQERQHHILVPEGTSYYSHAVLMNKRTWEVEHSSSSSGEHCAMGMLYIRENTEPVLFETACALYDKFYKLDKMPSPSSPGYYSSAAYRRTGGRTASAMYRTTGQIIAEVSPEYASPIWKTYTVFSEVILSAEANRRLTPDRRDALNKWVFSGGTLLVMDDDLTTGGVAEPLGNGLIVRVGGDIADVFHYFCTNDKMREGKRGYLKQRAQHAPRYQNQNVYYRSGLFGGRRSGFRSDRELNIAMPGFQSRAIGTVGALVIVSFFVVLVGPICYIYLRRKKRVRRMFIAVPFLSFCFCAVMIIYFIATAGASRKASAISCTLFDQTRNMGQSFFQTMLYSGLYPRGGFTVDNKTMALPMAYEDRPSWVVTDNSMTMAQGYFRPLVKYYESVIRPLETRERISIRREDDGELYLYNGWDTSIKDGFLSIANHVFFNVPRVPAGGRIKLDAPVYYPKPAWNDAILATLNNLPDLAQAVSSGRNRNSRGSLVQTLRVLGTQIWDPYIYRNPAGVAYLVLDKSPQPVPYGVEVSPVGEAHTMIVKIADYPEARLWIDDPAFREKADYHFREYIGAYEVELPMFKQTETSTTETEEPVSITNEPTDN